MTTALKWARSVHRTLHGAGGAMQGSSRLGRHAVLGSVVVAAFTLGVNASSASAATPSSQNSGPSSAQPAAKVKAPKVPKACNITGDPRDDVFTGAVNNGWNTAGNWSLNRIPGAGDFACIPATYGMPVSLNANDAITNYQILGVNDESSAGLAVTNWGITLTGTAKPSVVKNLVLNGISGSGLGVGTGVVLDLTGSSTIDSASTSISGPGTINDIKGSTVSTGPYTGVSDGLQWNNYGTVTGDGVGLCDSPTNPVVITNAPKAKMIFSSGGGLNDTGGCTGSVQGIVVNDAKASITVSKASFSLSAPFDNKGTVTDEKNPLTGSTGLTIYFGNTGANGNDTGTYTATSTKTSLGEINFSGPRDLTSSRLGGSGTFGFNAVDAGVDLADPTLASVVQTGTTNGGMVITKSITFDFSEGGENIQTDTGSPTSTVIDNGASVNFSNWNANFENGHSLVINAGGTLNLAGESLCLGPASSLTNSGHIVMSGSASGMADGYCGGAGGSVVNTASGSLTSSSSNGQITLPFENDGSVAVTSGTLLVDGNAGTAEAGSWSVTPSATLNFSTGTSNLSGTVSDQGTVEIECSATVDLAGQSFNNLNIAGQTTGDYSVTGTLGFFGFPSCNLPPTMDVPSGTIAAAGDFIPQMYNGTLLETTVSGPSSFGQLTVGGTAQLAGDQLEVTTASGFTPTVGESFQVLTAGSTSGNFSLTGNTCAGPGIGYQSVPDATGVSLNVVADGSCT